ncbi:MAG: hypothetical protein S4CHLAM7_15130 [Chlamydiae bacterium]|nr:hypothetical protein [Chlamydiota bacterium]
MNPTFQQVLEEHLTVFLFALFLSLITCFIAWYKHFFKLPAFDKKSIKVTLVQVLLIFLIYFGLSIAVPFVIIQILKTFPSGVKQELSLEVDAVRAWVNLILMAALLIVFFIYVAKLNQESKRTVLGERSYGGVSQNIGNVGMGVLTFLISFPLVLAVSQAFSILIFYFDLSGHEQVAVRFLKSTMENPVLFAITSLFIVIVVPTIEELLFRGFLQNWLARFFGRGGAVFLTALIFSGFHFSLSQQWGNLEIIPSLFTLALFLGFIYFRQKSIYSSIGLHATFNGVNIFLMSQAGL